MERDATASEPHPAHITSTAALSTAAVIKAAYPRPVPHFRCAVLPLPPRSPTEGKARLQSTNQLSCRPLAKVGNGNGSTR
eukprot:scaffold2811_cov25-Tisochrysis_lutea.AAC.2